MPMFAATFGSFPSISSFSQLSVSSSDVSVSPSISFPFSNQFNFSNYAHKLSVLRKRWCYTAKVSVSGDTQIDENPESQLHDDPSSSPDAARLTRRSADWKAARTYRDSGFIYDGSIEDFNGGGLLVRFYSLVGFLPFPQLSPLHSCKEPYKAIQDIAKGLVGSIISVKVVQADEDKKKLIFSEKEASWSRYSERVRVGDIMEAMVGSVEDYGAFVHLRFPDGLYHLTGLVHISEVSWDLVHDVRDILTEGDKVRVKVTSVDREKSRIKLSIKQLEEDPLLETLDKVIPQSGSDDLDSSSDGTSNAIEPLPGLETILEELLKENGIDDARISRQGFERRVVSQDLMHLPLIKGLLSLLGLEDRCRKYSWLRHLIRKVSKGHYKEYWNVFLDPYDDHDGTHFAQLSHFYEFKYLPREFKCGPLYVISTSMLYDQETHQEVVILCFFRASKDGNLHHSLS